MWLLDFEYLGWAIWLRNPTNFVTHYKKKRVTLFKLFRKKVNFCFHSNVYGLQTTVIRRVFNIGLMLVVSGLI